MISIGYFIGKKTINHLSFRIQIFYKDMSWKIPLCHNDGFILQAVSISIETLN